MYGRRDASSPRRPDRDAWCQRVTNSGVTFTNGHVTTALCCPSRTSILTGQYSHRTGVLDNNPPDGGAQVFDDSSTIATWLQAAGYRTGFVGKYLNGYASLSPYIPPGGEGHVKVQVSSTSMTGLTPASSPTSAARRRLLGRVRPSAPSISSTARRYEFCLHLSQKRRRPARRAAALGLFTA